MNLESKKPVASGIPIQLAEKPKGKDGKEKAVTIQIIKAGIYSHPWYGDLDITRLTIASIISNFEKKVIPNDLMIDYNHKCDDAAAWILSLYSEDEGRELWAEINTTPPGQKALDDKTYRYISIDLAGNYRNNETLEEYGPTLLGAALTNRPFIKGMAPVVNLNEKGENMKTLEEMKKENIQLNDKIETLETKLADAKKLSEQLEAKNKEIEALKKSNDELTAKVALSEKEAEFNVMLNEKKAVPAQKDAYLKGDMKAFASLAGTTKLKEQGSAAGGAADVELSEEQKEEEVIKLAEAKVKAGEFKTVGDAISLVLKENPKLKKA